MKLLYKIKGNCTLQYTYKTKIDFEFFWENIIEYIGRNVVQIYLASELKVDCDSTLCT